MGKLGLKAMKRHVLLFGHAVAKTRAACSMSREQLSRKAGLSLSLLERIETGSASPAGFGLDEICRIAGALKLKPCQLMERYEALLKRPRRTLRRLPYLAVSFCLASVLFPGRARAQGQAPATADVDSGKVQPLNLKPGCWQVRTVVVLDMTGPYKQLLWAQLKALQTADNLTPEQRAQMAAGAQATETNAEKTAGKNVDDRTVSVCTPSPFLDIGMEIYGSVAKQCAKTFQVSGQTRHIHVVCPAVNGDQVTDDYDRIDAGYFKGARAKVTILSETGPNGEHSTTTSRWTWIGKWIGEAAPHMPNGFVDVNGAKLMGPHAIAVVDPFRIVAEIGGTPFTAQAAYIHLNKVPVRFILTYGAKLSLQLQSIIMHEGIAVEAEKLALDYVEPWKSQLYQGGWSREFRSGTGANNSIADVGLDDFIDQAQMTSEAEDARLKILWNAYFSRAKTEAEKQAMLQKAQEQYKLTVIDPDFFDSQAGTHPPAGTPHPAGAKHSGAITIPKLSDAAYQSSVRPDAAEDAALKLPPALRFCAEQCLTLTLENGQFVSYTLDYMNLPGQAKEKRVLSVESFTPESVILRRTDYGSHPMTAVYAGPMEPGNNGAHGKGWSLAWGDALAAPPGGDAERQAAVAQLPFAPTTPLGALLDLFVRSDDDAALEEEEMQPGWAVPFPMRTLAGYDVAIACFEANEIAVFKAEKAGDQGAKERATRGARKSWIFAHRTGEQLGLTKEKIDSDFDPKNRPWGFDSMVKDEQYFQSSIGHCRTLGLVYDN